VIASRNEDKIKEMSEIIDGSGIEILSLKEFTDIPEIIEDKDTFKDNALKKARLIYKQTGIVALADDSGLEVDALEGRPGIYSARFAGKKATHEQNNDLLITQMKHVPENERTARFRCSLALVGKEIEIVTEGVSEGIILSERKGNKGFGYDSLFFYPELGLTFAELDSEKKNQISHRALAFDKMRVFLDFIKEKHFFD
ncbi:MAG: RdgB/HAM1 family non-canonical purine NTP pyrophosphatase, partial [Pedobacter sp.]